MANHLMRYKKGQRGLEYAFSLSVKEKCPKCGDLGYIQVWYSCLGSYVFSAQHIKKLSRKTNRHPTGWKTYRRCWF